MSRLSRKNREDIRLKSSGGLFDLFDNLIKSTYRINDEEYDYLCENMTNEEMELFLEEKKTLSQAKKTLALIDIHLNNFKNG